MEALLGVCSQHQPPGGAKLAVGVCHGKDGAAREAPTWKVAGHHAGCPADMPADRNASSASESGTASAQPDPAPAHACCACSHGNGFAA